MPGAALSTPTEARGTCPTPRREQAGPSRINPCTTVGPTHNPPNPTERLQPTSKAGTHAPCMSGVVAAPSNTTPTPTRSKVRRHPSTNKHSATHSVPNTHRLHKHSVWSGITVQAGAQGEGRREGACLGVHQRGARQGRVGASAGQGTRRDNTRQTVMMRNTQAHQARWPHASAGAPSTTRRLQQQVCGHSHSLLDGMHRLAARNQIHARRALPCTNAWHTANRTHPGRHHARGHAHWWGHLQGRAVCRTDRVRQWKRLVSQGILVSTGMPNVCVRGRGARGQGDAPTPGAKLSGHMCGAICKVKHAAQ